MNVSEKKDKSFIKKVIMFTFDKKHKLKKNTLYVIIVQISFI